MVDSPRSWQDVRSVGDLRSARQAASAAGVQAMVTSAAFNAITPFRCFDSRPSGRALQSGSETTVVPWRNERGVQQIPEDLLAVTYNLTIEPIEGSGFVSLYPSGTSFPGVSSVNWSGADQWSGVYQVIANNGTVRTGTGIGLGRSIQALVAGGGRTHIILDITGYYL